MKLHWKIWAKFENEQKNRLEFKENVINFHRIVFEEDFNEI